MSVQYEEKTTPSDTISSIDISRNNQGLALSSWDGQICCYGINVNERSIMTQPVSSINVGCPSLSCTWNMDGNQVIEGDANGRVQLWDVSSGSQNITSISQFNSSVIYVGLCDCANLLISGSLKGEIKGLDMRSPNNVMGVNVNDTIHAMTCSKDNQYIAYATQHKAFVYDIRNTANTLFIADRSTEAQPWFMNSLAFSPSLYFSYGSSDGRVCVKYLQANTPDLVFRVGRKDAKQYPVEQLCFHRPTQHLITTTGEGSLTLWNIQTKNKVSVFEKGSFITPHAITATCYSSDGQLLAYAKGYNWDEGNPRFVKETYRMEAKVQLYIRKHEILEKL